MINTDEWRDKISYGEPPTEGDTYHFLHEIDELRNDRRFTVAVAAMQAHITTRHPDYSGAEGPENVARDAVTVADALLAALEEV